MGPSAHEVFSANDGGPWDQARLRVRGTVRVRVRVRLRALT